MIRVCPLSALPRTDALRVEAEPPVAVFHTGEGEATVEEGSAESRNVLAVYRRGDEPVAVLGLNPSRLFGRWRRQLNTAPVPA